MLHLEKIFVRRSDHEVRPSRPHGKDIEELRRRHNISNDDRRSDSWWLTKPTRYSEVSPSNSRNITGTSGSMTEQVYKVYFISKFFELLITKLFFVNQDNKLVGKNIGKPWLGCGDRSVNKKFLQYVVSYDNVTELQS